MLIILSQGKCACVVADADRLSNTELGMMLQQSVKKDVEMQSPQPQLSISGQGNLILWSILPAHAK